MSLLYFSDKDPSEVIVLSVDWTGVMDGGETISSASWAVTNQTIPAEDTTAMKNGSTDASAKPVIRQKIQGGTDGSTYLHRCTVVTSAGRTLVQGIQQTVRLGA